MRRRWRRSVIVALAVSLMGLAFSPLAAGASVEARTSAKCPLGALKTAKKPVQITFWHREGVANGDSLAKLTDQFNASQSDVQVKLVYNTSYRENFDKFRAGLTSGDLPDVVQLEGITLQQAMDTRAVLPVQACVTDDHYSLKDTLPRVLDYYTVRGTLLAMPFNVQTPVLIYDKAAFRKAGLDPNKPPTTLAEIKADAQRLKQTRAVTKAGFGLKLEPWYLEQWLAKAGEPYANNGNGRKARATKVAFDTKDGRELFAWMADMVRSGLAETNNNQGPGQYDNLFGLITHSEAMTIDLSGYLGETTKQIQAGGEFAGAVEGAAAAMPGPVGKGGALMTGGGLDIVAKSSPEKQAAAWQFIKFLTSPQSQATWAADTGNVPIRKSAVDLPAIQQRWAETPDFKVAYDQLVTGVTNTATVGPVIGDYQGVRDVVHDAEVSMFTNNKKPTDALKDAEVKANTAIEEYNARVG